MWQLPIAIQTINAILVFPKNFSAKVKDPIQKKFQLYEKSARDLFITPDAINCQEWMKPSNIIG